MTQWLRLQLGNGTHDGRRILSSVSLRETQTPQTTIAQTAPWRYMFPGAEYLAYGLGWFVSGHHGRKIVSHGGNIDGMSAQACVVPEEQLGIVLLSNSDSTLLPNALLYRLLDEVFGEKAHSWLNEFYGVQQTLKAQTDYAEQALGESRLAGTKPSRPPSAYAGSYEDAFYGSATIEESDGELRIDCIGFRGTLEHWHLDNFTFVPENPILRKHKPMLRFSIDDFGEVSRVTMNLTGGVQLPFERKAQPAQPVKLSADELLAFEGSFESAALPITIDVEVLGDELKAGVPGEIAGQPDIATVTTTLRPIGDDRFTLATSPVIAVFDRTGGIVTRVRIKAPHAMPLEFEKKR